MKRESFQKKRRPSKGGLFVFHSKTRPKRRKKQRVAAGAGGADLGSEVPNLGVARALFVILILHVAAIAAIFIHNRVTDDEIVTPVTDAQPTVAAVPGASTEKLPRIPEGEDYYFVATGDTYERIARLKNVDVDLLRDLNDNVKLRAGRILRIPAQKLGLAPEVIAEHTPEVNTPGSPEPLPTPEEPPVVIPQTPVRVQPAAEPARSGSGTVVLGGEEPAPVYVNRAQPAEPLRVEQQEEPVATPSGPTRVTPNLEEAPRAVPVEAATYTVQKGDTAWGISRQHKVSVDQILKTNGITDARKLRPGMKLVIPIN